MRNVSDTDLMLDAVNTALDRIAQSGGVDGAHHKQWVLDQVVRILCLCPIVEKTSGGPTGYTYRYKALEPNDAYRNWVKEKKAGDCGPETYSWDEGIPP